MPAKTTAEIYQLKVTLLDTKPPIWRRLLAPASMTLERLHDLLQLAMGWHNSHLHEFNIGDELYGPPDPEASSMGLPATLSERTARLGSVMGWVGAEALYTYDFGDGWEHAIVVEKILAPEAGQYYPVCVAGKRRCPPEDCGGVGGFYNLLEAIGDPEHEEHDELLEWLGRAFDPEDFTIEQVNRYLVPSPRRAAKKARGRLS